VLVVDTGLALRACVAGYEDVVAVDDELVAPPLLWSEVRSALHEARWRGELRRDGADDAHARLGRLRVRPRSPAQLGPEAWRIADLFGWAKTYDAEFVALAALLDCRLVTVDARLRRGTERLGFVIGPTEL
jgi:predicted nucleic acid-binding protein